MSIWDDPDLAVGGEYFKFDQPGDTISGTIKTVRTHHFVDTKTGATTVAPQLLLTTDDGEDKTVTAGQIRLKLALAEQRPEPGDHITIVYEGAESRAGGKTLKHFKVTVTRGTGAPAAAPAFTPPPAAAGPALNSPSAERPW